MGIQRQQIISVGTRAVVSIVVLSVGILIFWVLVKSKPTVARREVRTAVLPVEAMTAARRAVQRRWEGFGTAEVLDEASVPSELSATVDSVPDELRVGSAVAKGQPIVYLNDVDVRHREEIAKQVLLGLEAQIAALEIERERTKEQLGLVEDELAATTADWVRAKESRERGGASESEVDAKRREVRRIGRIESELRKVLDLLIPRRAELTAALAEERVRLAMVQTDLARCTIRSPMEGILQALDVHAGERVTPGMRIARVVSLRQIEIPLRFPVSARQSISVGDDVELISEGAAESVWSAKIVRIAPESDRGTRTVIVYAEVAQVFDANPLLMPGQYVRAILRTAANEERFLIPRRSVLNGAIWVINALGEAERREIEALFYLAGEFSELGPNDSEWVVLGAGSALEVGETIVLSNLDVMTPGLRLRGEVLSAPMRAGAENRVGGG